MNSDELNLSDDVMTAIADYTEAKAEHDQKREAYDGYSWGYHGAPYVERMDDARRRVAEALAKYVDSRIEAAKHRDADAIYNPDKGM